MDSKPLGLQSMSQWVRVLFDPIENQRRPATFGSFRLKSSVELLLESWHSTFSSSPKILYLTITTIFKKK